MNLYFHNCYFSSNWNSYRSDAFNTCVILNKFFTKNGIQNVDRNVDSVAGNRIYSTYYNTLNCANVLGTQFLDIRLTQLPTF